MIYVSIYHPSNIEVMSTIFTKKMARILMFTTSGPNTHDFVYTVELHVMGDYGTTKVTQLVLKSMGKIEYCKPNRLCFRPNPISTPYPFPLPLRNKREG